jgi:thiol-disulfide isomerase/thioredoxin
MKGRLAGAVLALVLGVAAHAAPAEQPRPFEADSWRQIVASHQGAPFVVVVWSLDCDYCQPSFQALAAEQRRRKLAVVTIATDRADDGEAARAIAKKIHAAGLRSETWAFGSAPSEQLRFAIDPAWRGEMPRSYWFDSHGKAVHHSGVIKAGMIAELSPR